MADFEVTKEYREDLGEQDAEGHYDYEYRYWEFTFEFPHRTYTARIYTDFPHEATLGGPIRTTAPDEHSERDVRAIAHHLVTEEGVRKVLVPGGRDPRGYQSLDAAFGKSRRTWTDFLRRRR